MKARCLGFILCCLVPLISAGCFSSTDPFVVVALDNRTRERLLNDTELVALYWAWEEEAYGGHLTNSLVDRCDEQLYAGKGCVEIKPPKHVGFDPIFIPGTIWYYHAVAIAPGYELEFEVDATSDLPRQRVYRMVPLDQRTIQLESIGKIAWRKDEFAALDSPGIDAAARRRFAQLVLAFYETWRTRWGDPHTRQQYYRGIKANKGYDESDTWEKWVMEAEALAAKLKTYAGQAATSQATTGS